ncbi:MAG: hypothetical protein AB8B53_13240 [Flavobacteriales bacterium]
MKGLFTVILIVIGTCFSQAQELSMSLDRDTIFIGQPATVTYTFTVPLEQAEASVEWSIPKDSIAPGLEILNRVSNSEAASGNTVWTQRISFTSSATGYFPVAPVNVSYGGNSYASEAFLITSYTTLKNPEQEELRDIKESTEITYGWIDWLLDKWLIILLIVAVLILVLVAIKLLSPKSKAPVKTPEIDLPPPPTAYEVAQEKITELEASKIWKTGELKEFHTAISYLLREYLEGELHISALENTSGEINSALQKFNFPANVQKQIRVSLTLTDLVKFAKQLPSDSENELVLKDVKEVIDFIHDTEGKPKTE